MIDFKKCSAILKGELVDPSVQSPLFEMNRLSMELYRVTGLVKVRALLDIFDEHYLTCFRLMQNARKFGLKISETCLWKTATNN